MNAIEDLKEKKEKRWLFLRRLYDWNDGDESSSIHINRIGKELGFDEDLTIKIAQYLSGEGLIVVVLPITIGRRMDFIRISHAGVVEVEDALDNPDRPTQHFLPFNIINVNQMTNSNIQQASPEATQVVTFDESKYEELKEVILSLKESIDQLGLEPQQKSELQVDIQTIEVQISSPKPKATIITESIGSIKRILEGVAGSALASGLLHEIAPLFG